MKTKFYILKFAFFASCINFLACSSPADKGKEDKKDTMESEKEVKEAEVTQTDIENYKKETAIQITTNEQQIQGFREKIKEFQKDIKVEFDEKIASLEQKNMELKARLEEYTDKNMENWNQFKTEFKDDMKELGQAIKNFVIEE